MPHEARLIYISVDAVDMPLAGILPHGNVSLISEYRLLARILGNHYQVTVKFSQKMLVVEIRTCIDERPLIVGFLHEFKKLEEGITELLRGKTGRRFHVNHRNEVLLIRETLLHEVPQLDFLRSLAAVEMVRAYLQSVPASHPDVLFEAVVFPVSTLGSLYIYVCHVGIFAYRLPEDVTLIVGDVYSMDMTARILTLHVLCRGMHRKYRENEDEKYIDMLYIQIHNAKLRFFFKIEKAKATFFCIFLKKVLWFYGYSVIRRPSKADFNFYSTP